MSDVVVLGSANADLVVRQARLPHPGETMFGAEFRTVSGGKGLNQAIAAARSGASVAFLGAVGADAFGDLLRDTLAADGVDVAGLVRVDVPTGTAHISVLDGGENAITVVPSANAAVSELDAVARDFIRSAGYLVAQLERPIPLVTEAFRFAREYGATCVLTPAPVLPIDDELLRLADLLVPNASEARELAQATDDHAAALALSRLARTVIVTRGNLGALVARNGAITAKIPAEYARPVDTTAAGDTFVGYLVGRLAEGEELELALRAAAVAAAISVTRPGASTSIPYWPEVRAKL